MAQTTTPDEDREEKLGWLAEAIRYLARDRHGPPAFGKHVGLESAEALAEVCATWNFHGLGTCPKANWAGLPALPAQRIFDRLDYLRKAWERGKQQAVKLHLDDLANFVERSAEKTKSGAPAEAGRILGNLADAWRVDTANHRAIFWQPFRNRGLMRVVALGQSDPETLARVEHELPQVYRLTNADIAEFARHGVEWKGHGCDPDFIARIEPLALGCGVKPADLPDLSVPQLVGLLKTKQAAPVAGTSQEPPAAPAARMSADPTSLVVHLKALSAPDTEGSADVAAARACGLSVR
ncbi:MAG: hypothetical protein NTW87_21025, partial [Planctomycetota bacterium]|nr:hypothetical protein [Planctomycetota bacterium]